MNVSQKSNLFYALWVEKKIGVRFCKHVFCDFLVSMFCEKPDFIANIVLFKFYSNILQSLCIKF